MHMRIIIASQPCRLVIHAVHIVHVIVGDYLKGNGNSVNNLYFTQEHIEMYYTLL